MQGSQAFVIGGGRSGVWQLAKNFDGDLAAGLNDCLTAPGRYTKQFRGPFITGMIYPNVAGDKVMLLASGRDAAKQIWYRVKFGDSKAEGWVRSDFVRAPGRGTIAPAPKPVTQDAFLIVPGKSVGKITKQTDRQGYV